MWLRQRNRPPRGGRRPARRPDRRGVLRPAHRAEPPPLRGAARLPVRGPATEEAAARVRVLGRHLALSGARLPGRQDRVLPQPTARTDPGTGQERRPGARSSSCAGPGHSATQISEALAGTAHPAEPHRRRRRCSPRRASAGLPCARPPGSAAPPYRDHPPPRRAHRLRRAARPLPAARQPGCCSPCPTWSPWTCPPWSPPPDTPAPASSRRGQLRAVPAGAQTDRRPPGLPRRRPGRRPRRRTVRRADRAAEDHRPDHLLLPAGPHPAGRLLTALGKAMIAAT